MRRYAAGELRMALSTPVILGRTYCSAIIEPPTDADFDQLDPTWPGISLRDATTGVGLVMATRDEFGNIKCGSEENGNPAYIGQSLSEMDIYWVALNGFGNPWVPVSDVRYADDPPMPYSPIKRIASGMTVSDVPCSRSWIDWENEIFEEPEEPTAGWVINNFHWGNNWSVSSDDPKGWEVTYSGGQYSIKCPTDALDHALPTTFAMTATRFDSDHGHWHNEVVFMDLKCVLVEVTVTPAT